MPRKTVMWKVSYDRAWQASMRPRPDAAENDQMRLGEPRPGGGFNEAAARCRGKLAIVHPLGDRVRCASMRPRPDAAENAYLRDLAALGAILLQ